MLRFKQFVTESVLLYESDNDAKGKTAEIHTAFALSHHHGIPVADYREKLKGISSVDAEQKKKLGEKKHQEIKDNTQKIAQAVTEHIKKHHKVDISKVEKHSSVAWTSQAGDIGKHTGHDEGQENPSDIIISHHDGKKMRHFGVSIKYGKAPGLRSPGHKDMQNILNMPDEHRKTISRAQKHISDRVEHELGGHLSGSTKITKKKELKKRIKDHESGKKHDSEVAAAHKKASDASLAIRSNIISHYHRAFNSATPAQRAKFVRKMLGAEKSKFTVLKAHYNEKNGKVHVSNPAEEFDKFHKHVESYHSEHEGDKPGQENKATSHTIYAKMKNDHPDGKTWKKGQSVKIFTHQQKHHSGVFTPVGGNIGAPGAALKGAH